MIPSIIFSGMAGSGKSTIARNIAKRFGLKYLCGGDILQEMAKGMGFKPTGDGWWETNDGMRFLAMRDRDPQFDKRVDKLLINHIRKGGISATSWAVPWLIKDGFRVYLRASQTVRAKRIAGRDRTVYNDALAAVKKRDIENIRLYKRLYGHDIRDTTPFDLVINTDIYGIDQVTEIVSSAVNQLNRKA